MYRRRRRRVWLYRLTFGALFPTTCKYHPSCSQYALDAVRTKGLVRGSALAGWRLAALQPVEPRRVRPGPMILADLARRSPRSSTPRATSSTGCTARVGLPWAWSIVALTVIVRMLLVPLTVKQIHSMQNLQRFAPQMKEIQKKYKARQEEAERRADEVLPGEQHQPGRVVPADARAVPGLHRALLLAARTSRTSPRRSIPAASPSSTSSRRSRTTRRRTGAASCCSSSTWRARWRRRSTCRRPSTRRSARSSCSCRSSSCS